MKKRTYVVILGLVIGILLIITLLQIMVDIEAMKKLTITIEDVQITNRGLFSCDVLVTINFTNPSPRDVSVETAVCDVSIADRYLNTYHLSHLSFPSNSSQEQVMSLTLFYINIPRVVLEGFQNRNFDIDITGEAQVYVLCGLFTIPAPFSLTSTYS
jgi:hypothetical protein